MDEDNRRPIVGILTAPKLQLISDQGPKEGPYYAGTPAAKAEFHYGDIIIGMSDPDKPNHEVTEIPVDPRDPSKSQRDYFEFQRRLELLADEEVTMHVRRKTLKDGKEVEVDATVKVAPMYRLNLGVVMKMGQVLAVREGSSAHNEVLPPRTKDDKKLDGDVIEAVSVVDADGKTLEFKGDKLDPERLPRQLRQWSDRLDREKFKGKRMVKLHLIRHSAQGGQQFVPGGVDKELEWDTTWRFDRAAPFSLNAPMAIPELGLAYEIRSVVAAVTDPNSKLKVGDVVKNVRFDTEGFEKELPWLRQTVYLVLPFTRPELDTDNKGEWMKTELKEGQWAHVSYQLFQRPFKLKKVVFKIEREQQTEEVEIPITEDKSWPLVERGWALTSDTRRVTASDPFHAIWLGTVDTKNRMTEIFLNLRGMILGRIALTNLGGPLTIARATYHFAGRDFTDFLFFLGLISINLAVVNFLPIPVLDGGHMVFLIYEGIRKKPASEMVRIVATYIGLGIILLLMIFVLSLDVIRMFFSP